MNGITYFRLKSSYEGDVTKNCALTGNEVDGNFYTLEGRDIKSVEVQDGKLVINLMNGDKLMTDSITENCTKDLSFEFNEAEGVLTITQNGVTQTIGGFVTNNNVNNSVAVDGSIIGNGLFEKPLGVSPMSKTGQYRPVKKIIDTTNNEKLPSCCDLVVGERYLTIENVNEFGYLYNYQGLKEIACRLHEMGSQWRIPTKEDWDDMLDAVEPCEEFRNHTDVRSNKFLGKVAGKFLKSVEFWKKEQPCDCNCCQGEQEPVEPQCHCGRNIPCMPSYCGEYGTCHHRERCNNEGIDKYGFRVLPAGYATEAKDFLYFKERAYFWTASNHEYRDAYIKAFAYNKSCVLQDVMASDNYMSVRLIKNYNGDNFNESEEILGNTYSTVLMPSLKHGKTIWTSVNFAMADHECDCNCDCDCMCGNKYVKPNNGDGMEYVKKYFTNEWDGKHWLRKELLDGESVVVIEDNTRYTEYRLMDGELKDVSSAVYNKVLDTVTPIIEGVSQSIDDLEIKLDNEIERSINKDEELEGLISDLRDNLDNEDATIGELAQSIENETNARIAADEVLQGQIDEISQNFEHYHIQDGSEFDENTGVLTLKSKNGQNDIEIQFNFNFGTF